MKNIGFAENQKNIKRRIIALTALFLFLSSAVGYSSTKLEHKQVKTNIDNKLDINRKNEEIKQLDDPLDDENSGEDGSDSGIVNSEPIKLPVDDHEDKEEEPHTKITGVEWLAKELKAQGTDLNKYFSTRTRTGSSLDSTCPSWAPAISGKLKIELGLTENYKFSYRVERSRVGFKIFWIDTDISEEAVGTVLKQVSLHTIEDYEIVSETFVQRKIEKKALNGNTFNVMARAKYRG